MANRREKIGVRVSLYWGRGKQLIIFQRAFTSNKRSLVTLKRMSLSGAVCDQRVRLHGHRRHRPANTPGLPECAGSGRSPATHRPDHGERAGLESGAEDGTILQLQIISEIHTDHYFMEFYCLVWCNIFPFPRKPVDSLHNALIPAGFWSIQWRGPHPLSLQRGSSLCVYERDEAICAYSRVHENWTLT